MKGPVLGFRAWRVAKPTREMIERGKRPARVETPPGLAPSPELDAWLAARGKVRGPRFATVQPDEEPGTLLPISRAGRLAERLTWSQPGPVQFACPRERPHGQPARDCSCGLYANIAVGQIWHSQWRAKPETSGYVLGALIAWGHIVVHGVEGFRAEYARVVALSPPPDPSIKGLWAKRAAERLGVPCVPFDRLEQVGGEFGTPIRWRYVFE